MPIFTDDEWQSFADLAADLALKDDCETLEKNKTLNESGGYTINGWDVISTDKCLVTPFSKAVSQKIIGQQAIEESSVVISLPYGSQRNSSQRLRIKGIVYRVNKPIIGSYDVLSNFSAMYSTLD